MVDITESESNCIECKGGINFADVSNPKNILDGIVQDELLEFQKVGSGYILRTRMEHSREHIQHIKQQILQNQKDAQEYREQKYIYQKDFESASKIFNELTEEEYNKYSSAFVIMTWIANELASESQHKKLVDAIQDLHFIDVANCFPRIIESKELTSPDLVLLQIIIRHFEKLQNLLESTWGSQDA